ncbi:MAG: FAD:protein FMN transferase [Lachnospiraceae bacterium]
MIPKLLKKCFLYSLPCLFLLGSLLCLNGCAAKPEPISKSGFYLNTIITITLYDDTDASVLDDCMSLCESYESMLSRTIPGSDVWKINHSNTAPVTVSPETADLLHTALQYCALSNGLIDITVAPLSDLWDFSSDGEKHVPDSKAIAALLPAVNYQNITLDDCTVTVSDKDTALDLGFIAKGYIADKMQAYLLEQNVKSAIINLGGNVITIGSKPDHTSFQIGIQKPFDDRNVSIATVPSIHSSVVSSGVYERYFTENGKLYHHILNPKTGYPYENTLLGVTILSHTSLEGDALSTTCFVLGLEEGLALIERTPDVEAMFITDDYQLHYSSGFPH